MDFATQAERHAKNAESLPTYRGFSLLKTRDVLTELLSHIGRTPPFVEYTAHDISHIDALLRSLDWIIPASTQQQMSSSDWLLIVLAGYFHDLGLLVTRDEFEAPPTPGFLEFCETYASARPPRAAQDASHASLYQEFVRHYHAERVFCWISGTANPSLGIASAAAQTLDAALQPLGSTFRDDLGLVCLSHHLDDLGNLSKYPLRRPYGNSAQETANVQYAALVLRSVDLLHITSDRVPSVRHALIAPRDPTSQREWAKQQAVRSVRPQPKRDAEGQVVDEQADTIEIHATFANPDAFFALDTYLNYAREQLKHSYEWARKAQRLENVPHEFPWRFIDSSRVEAEGFIPREFRFEIDQANILDLLTGHTLYNDPTVAIREVLQNAVDAVRLQAVSGTIDTVSLGGFEISMDWDAEARTLIVTDAGTGMTQQQIEENFLRVGASRYQAQEFRKQYPEFYPISRFGIGVLSTFMVADCVDVYTRVTGEEVVRHLKLRDVHGRYLVRELPAQSADVPVALPHAGTTVVLRIREDVPLDDPLAIAKHWMVAPSARIRYRRLPLTLGEEVIGRANVAEALTDVLATSGVPATLGLQAAPRERDDVRVITRGSGGVQLAMAVTWSSYFRTWEFFSVGSVPTAEEEDSLSDALATCVEGIRVVSDSPGFRVSARSEAFATPVACANASGPQAPRTNVARSDLEAGSAASVLWRTVYDCFGQQLQAEYDRLTGAESFSPTRAVREVRLQASRILAGRAREPQALRAAMRRLPLYIVEDQDGRRPISLDDLDTIVPYYSIESSLISSLENVLGSVPGSLSLLDLSSRLDLKVQFPNGPMLPRTSSWDRVEELRVALHEPVSLAASPLDGAVTTEWVRIGEVSRWLSSAVVFEAVGSDSPRRMTLGRRNGDLLVPLTNDVHVDVPDGVCGVRIGGRIFMKDDLGLGEYLQAAATVLRTGSSRDSSLADTAVLLGIAGRLTEVYVADHEQGVTWIQESMEAELRPRRQLEALVPALVARLGTTVVLDPTDWQRKGRGSAALDDGDWV
jgi:hypothetical protein